MDMVYSQGINENLKHCNLILRNMFLTKISSFVSVKQECSAKSRWWWQHRNTRILNLHNSCSAPSLL